MAKTRRTWGKLHGAALVMRGYENELKTIVMAITTSKDTPTGEAGNFRVIQQIECLFSKHKNAEIKLPCGRFTALLYTSPARGCTPQ